MICSRPQVRECKCGAPIHQVNRQLGPTWVHAATSSEWCGTAGSPPVAKAEPIERWLPIPGYEGHYEVSDMGRVRSVPRVVSRIGGTMRVAGGIRAQSVRGDGRLQVPLNLAGRKKAFKVHRLVAAAFLGPCPDGLQVCHNDGDCANNRLENLRYDTFEANMQDLIRHNALNPTTHCKYGHELTADNTYRRRECLTCHRSWRRRAREARESPAEQRAEPVGVTR